MPSKDPRVDAYIAKSAPFAKPILKHLREIVHAACPQAEETMKWSFPHFDYKGVLGGMAAFSAHCSFGLWKASLVLEGATDGERDGMGHFGRITSVSDLPPDKVLIGYIRKAAELNEAGIKSPTRSKPKKREPLEVPDYFTAALKKNRKARATFDKFTYSHRKEYVAWVTEAKREKTRNERLATAIGWMAEGKSRHWKYQLK